MQAAQHAARLVADGELQPEDISEDLFQSLLLTRGNSNAAGPPDLLIRYDYPHCPPQVHAAARFSVSCCVLHVLFPWMRSFAPMVRVLDISGCTMHAPHSAEFHTLERGGLGGSERASWGRSSFPSSSNSYVFVRYGCWKLHHASQLPAGPVGR